MENVIVGVVVVIAAVVVGRIIYAAMTGKKGAACGGCCDCGDRDAGDSGTSGVSCDSRPASDRGGTDGKDAQR